jgi:predicted nucleic acid-binding protein
MLLAATCREVGATLITANARDFERIAGVMAFRYETSFPAI